LVASLLLCELLGFSEVLQQGAPLYVNEVTFLQISLEVSQYPLPADPNNNQYHLENYGIGNPLGKNVLYANIAKTLLEICQKVPTPSYNKFARELLITSSIFARGCPLILI
jgi:hypothetical protein